jgi:ABC-2 type transport system permease protein
MGIEPKVDRSEVGGRTVEQKVVLGAYVSSSAGDVTLSQIDRQTALEYELSRAIAATTDKERQISLGIVETDTFFGGPEIDGRRINWAYADSLKKLGATFKVTHIRQSELPLYVGPDPAQAPADPATNTTPPGEQKPAKTAPDVLLVPDPSSLNDSAADSLVTYMRAGHPCILLVDPLPFYWTYQHPTNVAVLNAPKMPRVSPQNPYSQVLASVFEPKVDGGSAARVMAALGIQWDHGQIVWNQANPHPNFPGKWPEYLGNSWPQYYGPYEVAFNFVTPTDREELLSRTSPIVQGINELLFFYPGTIKKVAEPKDDAVKQLEFIPLVSLGKQSGVIDWSEITFTPKQAQTRINPNTRRREVEEVSASSQITMEDLIVIRTNPKRPLDADEHVIAAHIRTPSNDAPADADASKQQQGLNVVVIADLDFVSDLYGEQEQALGQSLDNLKFVQNAIEVLAGETGFAKLRNRRPKSRTLTSVEQRINAFRQDRAKKQSEIEERIKKQLDEEQQTLDKATAKIQEDESLSFLQKLQQSSQEASEAQARFDRQQERLNKELQREIDAAKAIEQRQISALETNIRYLAIFLAPLPALLLGISVLTIRKMNENRLIRPDRKVH